MVRMKCAHCGMIGHAAATLDWDSAMFDEEIDLVEKIEFEWYVSQQSFSYRCVKYNHFY